MHVGFEYSLPAMMELLLKEGLSFDFPGSSSLALLKEAKLSRFKSELLYERSSSLLHCLEGFIGKIDFNNLCHHRKTYGMLASTAAFLMNAYAWDEQVEMYLRKVILESSGNGSRGVPSAFPTSTFEIASVSLTASRIETC